MNPNRNTPTSNMLWRLRGAVRAMQACLVLADVDPALTELDQVLRAKRGCRR